MAKILLVEDEQKVAESVLDVLRLENHLSEHAESGEDALHLLSVSHYDLLVLDWQLPGISGVAVCREYRAKGGLSPVLMLTGKSALDDKDSGFSAGADDYLTKPFELRELRMRIRALLRRPAQYIGQTIRARDLELDPATRSVTRAGQPVHLLPKEFVVLEFMMRHPGQVFTAEQILSSVWPDDADVTPGAVRTCLNRLRKKIDGESGRSIISNVYGVGYRLERE